MKKMYNQPELEIVVMEEELISTASVVVNADPDGIMSGKADAWEW